MGVTHFSILNSHPNVEIIAIIDPSKIIKSFFKRYKPNIKIYSNYTNFFNDLSVDAVIISTPPDSHFEICKLAAANNVNVFVKNLLLYLSMNLMKYQIFSHLKILLIRLAMLIDTMIFLHMSRKI